MKRTALALTALAVCGLSLLIWQLLHEELAVTAQGITVTETVDTAWVEAVQNGAFSGMIYQADGGAATQTVTYTVRLRNPGLLPADMVEIQLVSAAGDIAAYQEPAAVSIPAGGDGTLSLRLLTGPGAVYRRDLVITYYLWGSLHTIHYTIS